MPLKFQCNQDPDKMKSVNGKKFCDSCQKHVFDVRRKPIEKIVQLKKDEGECCVIIYEEQFLKVENILSYEQNSKRKHSSVLPYAAGLAALSLLPQINYSQSNIKATDCPAPAFARDESGKIISEQTIKPEVTETENKKSNKQILIKGHVRSSYKKIGKAHIFELGYKVHSANGDEYVKVFDFSSKITGNFKFKLTKEQLKLLSENEFKITCEGRVVSWAAFSFHDHEKPLQIDVKKRRQIRWVGKF